MRIREDLLEEAPGERVGRHRVARIVRKNGIVGVTRRRKGKTTLRGTVEEQVTELVDRNFAVDAPDQLWVADITYVPTWAGFLYLAVVLDAWSRRVFGWAMATTLATDVVLDALNMTVAQRKQALAEAKLAVLQYIEGFCNPRRRHSALDYLSPINHERLNPLAGAPRADGVSRVRSARRRCSVSPACFLSPS